VLEAGINDIVLIGAGIFFLGTLEVRVKRSRALKALNELRAIAHKKRPGYALSLEGRGMSANPPVSPN